MKEFLKKVAQFMMAVLVAPLIFIKNAICFCFIAPIVFFDKILENANDFTGSKNLATLGTLLLLPVIVPVGSIVGITMGVILGIKDNVDVMCEIYNGRYDVSSILQNIISSPEEICHPDDASLHCRANLNY